jgi:hypothetical protein
MSQLVKTKRQANFKDFKRFGAFKGLVEPKNVVFNSFVCKLGLFWHSWAFKTLQTRQINYYYTPPNEGINWPLWPGFVKNVPSNGWFNYSNNGIKHYLIEENHRLYTQ